MTPRREHGLECHWLERSGGNRGEAFPWPGTPGLFRCGRDALKALVAAGAAARGWRRVWMPTYGCEKTVAALQDAGFPVLGYRFAPGLALPGIDAAALRPGDVVVSVNTFGHWSVPPHRSLPVDRIEDHSHDPWSRAALESRAPFAYASLRKTLPVPDGAVVWSPAGLPVPRLEERDALAPGVAEKIEGMKLKAAWLAGACVSRGHIERLLRAGARGLGEGPPAPMSRITRERIECFPVQRWRDERRRNFLAARARLASLPAVRLVTAPGDGPCPFSLALALDGRERRDALQRSLATWGIHGTVLWPIEGRLDAVGREERDLAARILSLCCDGRYREQEMLWICARVADAWAAARRRAPGPARAVDEAASGGATGAGPTGSSPTRSLGRPEA